MTVVPTTPVPHDVTLYDIKLINNRPLDIMCMHFACNSAGNSCCHGTLASAVTETP
jgi:hypothetical protein